MEANDERTVGQVSVHVAIAYAVALTATSGLRVREVVHEVKLRDPDRS
jgi:hypothetical protein